MSKMVNFNRGGVSKPPRQSNFELLRIVAMLLVLVVHVDFFSLGVPTDADITGHPVSSAMRYIVESLALVCVNSYILISGYFGIKPNIKRVSSFIFMVLFWRVGIIVAVCMARMAVGMSIPWGGYDLMMYCIPGYQDWFVEAYVLLMFFAPLLNSFIEKTPTRSLAMFVGLYYLFIVGFDWCVEAYRVIGRGYSTYWFFGLYLIGALLRRIGCRLTHGRSFYFGCYVLVSIFAGVAAWGLRHWRTGDCATTIDIRLVSYVSPFVVASTISLFIAFGKMSFTSRFVNRVAASTFAVYLVHMHPMLSYGYQVACRYLFDNFGTWVYILLIGAFVLAVFSSIVLADRVRIWLWGIVSRRIDFDGWRQSGERLALKFGGKIFGK